MKQKTAWLLAFSVWGVAASDCPPGGGIVTCMPLTFSANCGSPDYTIDVTVSCMLDQDSAALAIYGPQLSTTETHHFARYSYGGSDKDTGEEYTTLTLQLASTGYFEDGVSTQFDCEQDLDTNAFLFTATVEGDETCFKVNDLYDIFVEDCSDVYQPDELPDTGDTGGRG